VFLSLPYLLIILIVPFGAFLLWTKWLIVRREKQFRRPFDDLVRPVGWTLQRQMDNLTWDFVTHLMGGIAAAITLGALTVAKPENAPFALVVGFAISGFMYWRASRILQSFFNHRLGFLGEQFVGQILDRLSSDTIRVFHNLEVREPGQKPWNIDHIVLTPAGVFAIETKCRRKPRGSGADGQQGHKVIFDGQQLIFPQPMGTNRFGLEQAENNATWLAEKLSSLNGTRIEVDPVLVLPGWWVDAKGKGRVSVMNPKALKSFLTGRKPVLSDQLQRSINAQLEERSRIDLSNPI
jgi:hypothetical protein